ncbi:MAG: HIT family protein [Nitrosopumilaceae archaeon]
MGCIFCDIISEKIPARKIMETERSLAFLDTFPLTKGHSIVIPKNHYSKIQEMNKDDNTDLFELVRVLTKKIEDIFSSSLIAIHNGKDSGQEIPHVHVHIIPRTPDDDAGSVHSMFRKKFHLTNDELDQIAKKLRL